MAICFESTGRVLYLYDPDHDTECELARNPFSYMGTYPTAPCVCGSETFEWAGDWVWAGSWGMGYRCITCRKVWA